MIRITSSAFDALEKYVEEMVLSESDVDSMVKRLESVRTPLVRSVSRYPFSASRGEWWVEKFFSIGLRVFFSIEGDVLVVEHLDIRNDNTYVEAQEAWKART